MAEKQCPYCFTAMDSRASVCPACKKAVGKASAKGVAAKHYSLWGVFKVIVFFVILGFLLSWFV